MYENMVMYGVEEGMFIDMFYRGGTNQSTDLNISNITFRNITMHGTHSDVGRLVAPGYFHCQESSPCHGIHLEDVVSMDSKVPFDCYNAFGECHHVSPTPCLGKERSGLLS